MKANTELRWEVLEEAFKKFFTDRAKSDKPIFKESGSLENGQWIYCPVDNAVPAVHYELEKVCGEWFVALHFELYHNDKQEWRKRLAASFATAKAKRYFIKGSHYSKDFWRSRNPVNDVDELKKDLEKIVESVENSGAADVPHAYRDEREMCSRLELPCSIGLRDVFERVSRDNLCLPHIQRGKVWNAARCATLWDSIMRGFSIGALSVQPDNDGRYALLDGQQRSTAICLAYADFPPTKQEHLYDSILWIDLKPNVSDECQYHFYVTTASQPWGYERSTDETRNIKLKAFEIKEILNNVNGKWHNSDEKPYPFELWPKKAKMPVPFALLRDYVDEVGSSATLDEFIRRYQGKKDSCWNWVENLTNSMGKAPDVRDIFEKISSINRFGIQVLDAGNVTEDDMSLYFTRIGRGGVVPSSEELAYSVLKSKIGGVFREKIEEIVQEFGLDKSSRVAALAVRFCISRNGGGFYTGSVLDKIIEGIKTKRAGEQTTIIDKVLEFVEKRFKSLVEDVNRTLCEQGYTNWHITRYCQRHGGAVYQFLLMLKASENGMLKTPENELDALNKAFEVSGLTLGGVAELLSWYAPNPVYVIRKILERNNFAEAIAQAMRDSHYGSARMSMPVDPFRIRDFIEKSTDWSAANDARENDSDAARVISSGYGNEAAYSKLIFACNNNCNGENVMFKYNPNIGVWADDNCPWDYDHILPHSWVDNLPKDRRAKYAWLVDSIGNLAPIDFSLNRQLSNDERNDRYPCINCKDAASVEKAQRDCFVLIGRNRNNAIESFAELIGKMAQFRKQEPESGRAFCISTLRRFLRIYEQWYASIGLDKLFHCNDTNDLVQRKNYIVEHSRGEDKYCDHNGKWIPFDVSSADAALWFVWEWISLGKVRINRHYKFSCLAQNGNPDVAGSWGDAVDYESAKQRGCIE